MRFDGVRFVVFDRSVEGIESTGNLAWVEQAGGPAAPFVEGTAIALDIDGNPHVTGSFSGSAVFGSGQPNETTLVTSNFQNVFVAKYGGDGQLAWVKQAGGVGGDSGSGISLDGSGNCFVTGAFVATATFGAGEANETTLASAAIYAEAFVAKYDSAGMLAWAKQTTGVYLASAQGIAVDGAGHAYVAGTFGNVGGNFADPTSVTFGAGEPNQTVLTTAASSGTEVFVARYNNDAAVTPGLDLDITALRVTGRQRTSRPIRISASIRNSGSVNGSATLRIVGRRNADVVYDLALAVSDPVGNGATAIDFPFYVPVTAGDITWTASLADGDPDVDEATATTRVVP